MASKPSKTSVRAKHFVQTLSEQERMLIILKKELYEGCWNEMLADLSARLDGKPYIFKLANRIEDDINRIERIIQFEKQNNVDLGDYVKLPQPDRRKC